MLGMRGIHYNGREATLKASYPPFCCNGGRVSSVSDHCARKIPVVKFQSGGCVMPITVEMPEIESKALAKNPLGDPSARKLPILRYPPEYESSGRRYPVIVGLTGFTGRGMMMLNDSPWGPNLTQRLEALYAGGHARHAIFILPDCFTDATAAAEHINSARLGRYEDPTSSWADSRRAC